MAIIRQSNKLRAPAALVLGSGDVVGAGGAWQLESGEYVATRIALKWANPTGSEGTGSRYKWAHSTVGYNAVFAPCGGSPPYHFEISGETTGLSITKKAPSWNSGCFLWAEVNANTASFPSGSRAFTVTCYDQAGASITVNVTVTVDDSKFVFVDAAAADDSGTGAIGSPFKTINGWYKSSASDTTHQNKIVYYRAGTYTVDNFDSGITSMRVDNAKPTVHLAHPGESVTWTVTANIATASTGTTTDWYFSGLTLSGSDSTVANARVFALLSTVNRAVFHNLVWVDPVAGTSGTDNTSCLFSSNAGTASKANIAVVNGDWSGMASAANGVSAFDFYACTATSVLGGQIRGSLASDNAWVKNANSEVCVYGVDAWDKSTSWSRMFYMQNGSAPAGAKVHLSYCKVGRSEDGLFGNSAVLVGEANYWGDIWVDRCTVVGRFEFTESTPTSNGTAANNIVINDQSPVIKGTFTDDGNVTAARASEATYLDSNGNVQNGYSGRFQKGATVRVL